MASKIRVLQWLSFLNVALGILVVIIGIASINVTDFYVGVFGMGIWIGGWMLLTGVAGMGSAAKPGNYCRLGVFVGCCMFAIVIMIICNIVIGTVVIKHFHFEATVTREYYKNKNLYHKPREYFQQRNKAGQAGLAVYSSLMVLLSCDIMLNAALLLVRRDRSLTQRQATTTGSNNNQRASTQRNQTSTEGMPTAGQTWSELGFHFKLPNYADLYPEGITDSNLHTNEQRQVSHCPQEPPPAYSPRRPASLSQHSSLPGQPFVLPCNSHATPVMELRTVVEDCTRSITPSTPATGGDASITLDTPEAVENSIEFPSGNIKSSERSSLKTPSSLVTSATSHSQLTLLNSVGSSHSADGNSSRTLPNALDENYGEDIGGLASNQVAQYEITKL